MQVIPYFGLISVALVFVVLLSLYVSAADYEMDRFTEFTTDVLSSVNVITSNETDVAFRLNSTSFAFIKTDDLFSLPKLSSPPFDSLDTSRNITLNATSACASARCGFVLNGSDLWTLSFDKVPVIMQFNNSGLMVRNVSLNIPPVAAGEIYVAMNSSKGGFWVMFEDSTTNNLAHVNISGSQLSNVTLESIAYRGVAENGTNIVFRRNRTVFQIYDLNLQSVKNITSKPSWNVANQVFVSGNGTSVWLYGKTGNTDYNISRLILSHTGVPYPWNLQNNGTGTVNNTNVTFGVLAVDDDLIHSAVFAHNNSGTWQNVSIFTMSGNVADNINTSMVVTAGKNRKVCGQFWINDSVTSGSYANFTQTTESCFTVTNILPVANSVKINNTPLSINSANASASFSDADNDTQSAIAFQWFINHVYNNTGDNQSLFLAGNYTTNDNVTVSVRVRDGTDWGIWVNSSTVVVGDSTSPVISVPAVAPDSVNVNSLVTITVNVTDLSSSITSVVVEVEDPNSVKTNLSNMALVQGGSGAGQLGKYERNYTPGTSGNYYLKFYAVDGSVNVFNTADRNLTFTAVNPPLSFGGGASGGQTSIIEISVGNETVVIDFGRPSLTITIIAAPKQGEERYVIQNIGNKRFEGDILLSDTLKNYLSAQICSLVTGDCSSQGVTVSAGEKSLLVLNYNVPRTVGNGVEGLLRLEESSSGDVFELPLKIARPPGYGLYVKIADNYLDGDEGKAAVVFLLGSLGLLVIVVFAGARGI